MQWLQQAKDLRAQGASYGDIATQLDVPKGKVYYHLNQKDAPIETPKPKRRSKKVATESAQPTVLTTTQIKEHVLKMVRKGASIEEIAYTIKADPDAIEAAILSLNDENFIITQLPDKKYILQRHVLPAEPLTIERDWAGDTTLKIGIVSDTHMCSKYQQESHLHAMYDLFAHEGITDVYHAGDIVEGLYPSRPGHIGEVFAHSSDAQANYVVKHYPRRDGITTHLISGNHDHTFLKLAGHDICRAIARDRDDIVYYGPDNASFMLTPNCRMDIMHPGDGSSYALSYSLQKTIESLPVNDLPNILIVGHHHKSIYFNTRGIHALEAGTFQSQSAWMKGKRLAAHVGGWIITLHLDITGKITRFTPQWVPFDDTIKQDYQLEK